MSSPPPTLTALPERRVYQRSGTLGTVFLSGTFSGTFQHVQARVLNHADSTVAQDWITVATAAVGNNWSGSLSVPQGGWYRLQVRFLNSSQITTGATKWGVGDVWLLVGSTLQARFTSLASTPPTPSDRTAVFDGTTTWGLPGTIANTSGNGGITFLNAMEATANVPQALVQGSTEPAPIANWSSSGTAYLSARAKLAAAGQVAGILWAQDPGDIGTNTASYKTQLSDLKSRLESAATVQRFCVLPLVYNFSGTFDDIPVHPYRKAGFDFIIENPGVINLGWLPNIVLADSLNYPWAGNTGYEAIAYAYAHALLFAMGLVGQSNLGPSLVSATRTGSTVRLSVQHRSGSSLKLFGGTQATGFEVFPRGVTHSTVTPLGISSISMTANVITLTLTADPGNDVDIYYQYGKFTNTSAIYDNVAALGRTTGNALLPLLDHVSTASSTNPSSSLSALRFNSTTQCVTYADSSLWDFPDADWTIGFWSQIADNTGSNSQYFFSNGPYQSANTVNVFFAETLHALNPNTLEVNLRGANAQSFAVLGPGDTALASTTWRLWMIEYVALGRAINIYHAVPNGPSTFYHGQVVTGLGPIAPTGVPTLATRSPATAGSLRWLNGSMAYFFKMSGRLSRENHTLLAAGKDLVTDLGMSPQIYTKLGTEGTTIPNSGMGGEATATKVGSPILVSGPQFTSTPVSTARLVAIDGLIQPQSAYTLVADQVVFTDALPPRTEQDVRLNGATAWAIDRVGDGVVKAWTLPSVPTGSTGAMLVALDGIIQVPSSYTMAGNILTFSEVPPKHTIIDIRQLNMTALLERSGGGGQVAWTLPQTIPGGPSSLRVIIDGILQPPASYSITGTQITISQAPPQASVIDIRVLQ